MHKAKLRSLRFFAFWVLLRKPYFCYAHRRIYYCVVIVIVVVVVIIIPIPITITIIIIIIISFMQGICGGMSFPLT